MENISVFITYKIWSSGQLQILNMMNIREFSEDNNLLQIR